MLGYIWNVEKNRFDAILLNTDGKLSFVEPYEQPEQTSVSAQ